MRLRCSLSFLTFCLLFGAAHSGCSTADKNEIEKSRAWVDQVALVSLHYRRPSSAGADPQAGPGGVDYQSQPLPSSRLDCEPAEKLFENLKLDAIRECLASLQGSPKLSAQDFILTFSVQKSIQPALILRKEEVKKDQPRRPACVDELLAEIPVPREIYFQGVREGQKGELGCFASGLKPEAPPLLGVRLISDKTEVAVRVPPLRPLKTKQDVRLLLLTWALRPFWEAQRNQIEARVVPDRLCQLCIGEKNLVRMGVPPVPLWPAEGEIDLWQALHDAKP